MVLACGRRWGKTDACAARIALTVLGTSHSRQLILAPTAKQARILFDRVCELLLGLFGEGSEQLRIRGSSFPTLTFGAHTVMARSGHEPRYLRGEGATHIFVDEAAFVCEALITEVAMPMLATTDGEMTLISTSNGRNHFWRFFRKGQDGANGFWSRRATSDESPHVRPEFLEMQRELVSERSYRTEYEAEFFESAGRVFAAEAVEQCVVRVLPPSTGNFYVGVDWARYHDLTAIAVLQGDRKSANLVQLETLHGMPWRAQMKKLAELVGRYHGARIACDSTGAGDVAYEMLKEHLPGIPALGVTFTSDIKRNLIEGLARMIEDGKLKMLPDPWLLRELEHYEAQTRDSGTVKMGGVAGVTDDRVIALALAVSLLSKQYDAKILVGPERLFQDG